MQIRHSDSFELDREEEIELNGLRRESLKLFRAVEEEEERRGEVPVILVGETTIPLGGRWDDSAIGEEGEGAEQAGVILGSVLPLSCPFKLIRIAP